MNVYTASRWPQFTLPHATGVAKVLASQGHSMSNESQDESLHRIKNHLSVIFGFVELALEDPNISASVRADLLEIKKAAESALVELPNLERVQR